MDMKKILHGFLGKSDAEQKARRSKWSFSEGKSEVSKKTRAGHKPTTGKRYEY